VVTQAEFDAWMISQKPKYQTVVLDNLKPAADSAAKPATAVVAPAAGTIAKH
jgi:hypothetical protein